MKVLRRNRRCYLHYSRAPKYSILLVSFFLHYCFLPLPPAVTDKTPNSKWCKHEIKDAGVQTFSWFFTQLGSCFCTNRTLRFCSVSRKETKKNYDWYRNPLFHYIHISLQRYKAIAVKVLPFFFKK